MGQAKDFLYVYLPSVTDKLHEAAATQYLRVMDQNRVSNADGRRIERLCRRIFRAGIVKQFSKPGEGTFRHPVRPWHAKRSREAERILSRLLESKGFSVQDATTLRASLRLMMLRRCEEVRVQLLIEHEELSLH